MQIWHDPLEELIDLFGSKITIIDDDRDMRVGGKSPRVRVTTLPFVDEDEIFTNEAYIPHPALIQRRGRATIVHWDDGSRTKVVLEAEQPDNDFAAFTAALAKRVYGSTDKVIGAMKAAAETTYGKAKKNA